jgi:hypothetical protein
VNFLMNWQRRLRDIAIAGGLVGGAAYGITACYGIPACNASPDPCCGDPGGAACQAEQACAAKPTQACCVGDQLNESSEAQGPCRDAGFGPFETSSSSSSGGGPTDAGDG